MITKQLTEKELEAYKLIHVYCHSKNLLPCISLHTCLDGIIDIKVTIDRDTDLHVFDKDVLYNLYRKNIKARVETRVY